VRVIGTVLDSTGKGLRFIGKRRSLAAANNLAASLIFLYAITIFCSESFRFSDGLAARRSVAVAIAQR
jgi:hypothetical protein